jgi:CRISPR/Cas system-associated exonuclease Cas4 (RecB family)
VSGNPFKDNDFTGNTVLPVVLTNNITAKETADNAFFPDVSNIKADVWKEPEPLNLSLSYSMIAAWQSCRHKWWLQYDQRYRPAAVSEPMDIGSAVHAAMESVLRGNSLDEGIEEYRTQLLSKVAIIEEFEVAVLPLVDSVIDQARRIAARGIRDLQLNNWETCVIDGVPAIEMEFEAPVPGFKRYVGKVDWIAREKATGDIFLWEFKTRKTLQPEEAELYDQQKSSYQYLLRRYGIETVGSKTYQMLTKPIKPPKINKNGSVARSKTTCDWETYAATVRAVGQNPADYYDMQAKLPEFFRLTTSRRGHDEVTNVWEQIIVPVAQEIATQYTNTYRTLNYFNCKNCLFREPCVGALRGYDVSDMLSRQFHRGNMRG